MHRASRRRVHASRRASEFAIFLYAAHESRTGGPVSATPIFAEDGIIYVLNGVLMAASPEGKMLAKTGVSGAGVSSPTLAPGRIVYVASRTGGIVAFAGTHGGLMDSPWPKFQADPANSGRARHF